MTLARHGFLLCSRCRTWRLVAGLRQDTEDPVGLCPWVCVDGDYCRRAQEYVARLEGLP